MFPGFSGYVIPSKESLPRECFPNVERYIKTNGGNILYGWQIWEWPKVLVEAEFHAIWVSPLGAYIDITPKDNHENKIFFLPSIKKSYQGRQIDNIRKHLTNDPIIHEFIKISKRIFMESNKGDLAFKKHMILTSEMKVLLCRKDDLLKKILLKYPL